MLYIIRHGKTPWNKLYKLQGRTDIALCDEGREMAREAKKELDQIPIDYCFSSPLIRAKETAEILMEGRDVPIITDDRLVEMSFGVCEGMDHVLDNDTPKIKLVFSDPAHYEAVEEGESFEELFARTGSFLKEVALPLVEEGKNVLIVGHGAMNNSIVCQIRNMPLADFWKTEIVNCKLIKLI